MHDDVIASFDACLNRLIEIRATLVAARPVQPGERRAAVEQAIVVADTFATLATRAIATPAVASSVVPAVASSVVPAVASSAVPAVASSAVLPPVVAPPAAWPPPVAGRPAGVV